MRSVLDFSLIAIGIDYKCSVVKDKPAAEKRALRNEKSRQGWHERTKFGSRYAEIGVERTHSQAWNPAWTIFRVALISGCLFTPVRFFIFSQSLMFLTRNAGIGRALLGMSAPNISRGTHIKHSLLHRTILILEDGGTSHNFQQITIESVIHSDLVQFDLLFSANYWFFWPRTR